MHRTIAFAGLDEPQQLPTSFRRLQRRHGAETVDPNYTLGDVLQILEDSYNVEWRDLFHPAASGGAGASQSVENYRCLVNPAWIDEDPADLPDDREDAVWHIPTKTYTRVPHHEAFQPLVDAIRQRGDGDRIFGVLRLRQDGGEAHIDVYHRDASVDTSDAEGEDITLGISTGEDYLGGTRLYVDAVAYHDTGDGVGQVMRDITDARKRKHTGNAGQQVVSWYDNAFNRLDKVSDTLYQCIADAMNYEVPMPQIPCSLTEFYEHLGLANKKPNNLADQAAERAVQTATGPYTSYHLYKAGMWAVEHEYSSSPGAKRFRENVEAVNTLLFNPAFAERQVLSEVESVMEEAEDSASVFDYTDEDPDVAIDTVRERAQTISEGVEDYQDTRERLRKMLEDEGVEVQEADS